MNPWTAASTTWQRIRAGQYQTTDGIATITNRGWTLEPTITPDQPTGFTTLAEAQAWYAAHAPTTVEGGRVQGGTA